MDIDGRAGERVIEDDAVGMKGEARGGVAHAGRRVEIIAEDRAADGVEMDADLVEASGEQAALDERGDARGFEDAIGGDRGLAAPGDASEPGFSGGAVGDVAGVVFGDGHAEHALGLFGRPLDHGPVELLDGVVFELLSEAVVGIGAERDDEDAAGGAVEAVEEAEVARLPEVLQGGAEAGEEAVEKRVVFVCEAGLGDGAGRFVDDDEGVVLEEDLEGDLVVGLDAERGHAHLKSLAA